MSRQDPKILVIRPGGIGDAVLLYPALKALRESFEHAQIDVLAERRNSGILEGCTLINNLLLYDSLSHFGLIKAMKGNYDMTIDTEQWHRFSAVVSYLTRAPIRVGFATNERGSLYSHAVSYSHDDYEVHSFFNLVSVITHKKYHFERNEPFIVLDPIVKSRMVSNIKEFRRKWRALVGVFPGATIAERRWGIKKFTALSGQLIKRGVGIVLLGGKADLKNADALERIVGKENIQNFVGRTSLLETSALISSLDLLISGDTGLMHISYGVGTPAVSLFGSGIQRKWAPLGERHIILNKNLPCSPCTLFGYTPKCPYQIKCLEDITVEEVLQSVLGLIARCS